MSGVGSSVLSRCATAKTRRSPLRAASMARSVPGRPAAMGAVRPGKITVPLSGSTGSVWRVAMSKPDGIMAARRRRPILSSHVGGSKEVARWKSHTPFQPPPDSTAGVDTICGHRDVVSLPPWRPSFPVSSCGATMSASCLTLPTRRVPDPLASAADDELRAHVERALAAHYELDCEIGRGGMGIVYRAKDKRLKRQVAIKLLPPELAFRSDIKSRFLREAETAAQLSHPNIVPIYTVDEQEQLVFFVMAYISGDNLAKRLHERGVLTVEETRKVLREVADALAYAHDRGVVHRDIKPDNILLDAATGRPMVTDFGIARAMDSEGDSRLTATGMAIGTPAYMSPEQAAGEREIDGRSDLYSLGILGYQMLTGEPPFVAGSTPAILVKHISERPIPVEQRRADVPQDLARIIMVLLEKDPAHRIPSANAVVSALDTGKVPERGSGESSVFGAGLPPMAPVAPMPSMDTFSRDSRGSMP